MTDPNDNRTQYGFTPFGMLKKTAVMGKNGESKGDTLKGNSIAKVNQYVSC